LLTGQNTKVW